MINFRLLRNSDRALWICAGALILIGFLSIYSATFAMMSRKAAIFTESGIDPWIFMKRHLATFMFGAFGLSVFAYLDYNNLKTAAVWLYGIMILLLLSVLVTGYESYGAQRWIGIGPFSFQPSEISKLVLIITVARWLEDKKGLRNISDLLPTGIMVLIPFLLIFKQPDLGTALVFIAITAGMVIWTQDNSAVLFLIFTPLASMALSVSLYLWIPYLLVIAAVLYAIDYKFREKVLLFAVNLATGLAVPFAWGMLREYQKQRLFIFRNPSADPFGAGYHTIQSQIAIGAGGLFGRGFLHGTQTQLQFIPQQWTDFIFSMIGEEFGLIGTVFVILLFSFVIWRAIVIAMDAADFFGSLLASGIAAMFTFHVAVNIGMTLGVAPVVGIPLPFISFGGTSLIVNMCAIGILQSIAMRREKLFF